MQQQQQQQVVRGGGALHVPASAVGLHAAGATPAIPVPLGVASTLSAAGVSAGGGVRVPSVALSASPPRDALAHMSLAGSPGALSVRSACSTRSTMSVDVEHWGALVRHAYERAECATEPWVPLVMECVSMACARHFETDVGASWPGNCAELLEFVEAAAMRERQRERERAAHAARVHATAGEQQQQQQQQQHAHEHEHAPMQSRVRQSLLQLTEEVLFARAHDERAFRARFSDVAHAAYTHGIVAQQRHQRVRAEPPTQAQASQRSASPTRARCPSPTLGGAGDASACRLPLSDADLECFVASVSDVARELGVPPLTRELFAAALRSCNALARALAAGNAAPLEGGASAEDVAARVAAASDFTCWMMAQPLDELSVDKLAGAMRQLVAISMAKHASPVAVFEFTTGSGGGSGGAAVSASAGPPLLPVLW